MHVKSCVFCWKGGRTVKDELIRSQIHQAVDHHSEHLQSNPFLAQRIINQERTGEPVVKKRLSIGLVLVIVLMLIAVTALAYTVITAVFSPRVDAYTAANQALEEKYGLTSSMLGFFSRDSRGNDGHHFIVEYEPRFEDALASKLGAYRVFVMNGQIESVTWSLDGRSTEGGFDADAWGADQLGEMVRIASVTNDTSRFQRKASGEDIDLYADMELISDGADDEGFPEVDQQIENEISQFRQEVTEAGKEIEAQSKFTRDELIELGRQGIITAYHLDSEQQQRLAFVDNDYFIAYYSTIGIDQRPTFNMTFQSWSEDGWQDGDGVYTIIVNVIDGTVEYLEYDTTLDGNG